MTIGTRSSPGHVRGLFALKMSLAAYSGWPMLTFSVPTPSTRAFELVAGLELRDAGGRAGHDDVAGGELHLLRELPDDFRARSRSAR